jgi:hypothetical protein
MPFFSAWLKLLATTALITAKRNARFAGFWVTCLLMCATDALSASANGSGYVTLATIPLNPVIDGVFVWPELADWRSGFKSEEGGVDDFSGAGVVLGFGETVGEGVRWETFCESLERRL